MKYTIPVVRTKSTVPVRYHAGCIDGGRARRPSRPLGHALRRLLRMLESLGIPGADNPYFSAGFGLGILGSGLEASWLAPEGFLECSWRALGEPWGGSLTLLGAFWAALAASWAL